EVTLIVTDSYEKAKKLLFENMDVLHRLAAGLLEKEVLNLTELDAIIALPPQLDGKKEDAALHGA
ncbi:MAG: hypothetical protein Q7I93_00590, partial [Syntrophales bacterium]|nr:hypothetical protein [Syntrophales bacterium]